jgi:hypothetical protein
LSRDAPLPRVISQGSGSAAVQLEAHNIEIHSRAEALAANASAALLGDLDAEAVLMATVLLGERIRREVEVLIGEAELRQVVA